LCKKIKFNFAATETIVYSIQTLCQQAFERMAKTPDRQAFQGFFYFIHVFRLTATA
jgi:hypothetical protein